MGIMRAQAALLHLSFSSPFAAGEHPREAPKGWEPGGSRPTAPLPVGASETEGDVRRPSYVHQAGLQLSSQSFVQTALFPFL